MIKTAIIIEDHFSAREILLRNMKKIDKDIKCLTATNLSEARDIIAHHMIDLALLDINLPDGNGIDIITELKQHHPHCLVVMSTVYDDDDTLFDALRAGANGYLLKQDHSETLFAALSGILTGNPPLSPAMAQRIVEHFHPSNTTDRLKLTGRETEVLLLLASGYDRNEISQSLKITKNTVCGYGKQIYTKLEVSSCAQATLKAVDMGLVKPSSY